MILNSVDSYMHIIPDSDIPELEYRYIKLSEPKETMYSLIERVQANDGQFIINLPDEKDGKCLYILEVRQPGTEEWEAFSTVNGNNIQIDCTIKKPFFKKYYEMTFKFDKKFVNIHGSHLGYFDGTHVNAFTGYISDGTKFIFRKEPFKNQLRCDRYLELNFKL